MPVEHSCHMTANPEFYLNGDRITADTYLRFHVRRFRHTLEALRKLGARKVVEVGGHPWWMTAQIVDDPHFELSATVSAEEVTKWPEEIGVTCRKYSLTTASGRSATFTNYSANIERTLFELSEQPDTVLACETIEHLIRSPHVMLLNMNRWLPVGGKLLITTPNGAQFMNPFRLRHSRAYRCHVYERHQFTYTLEELVDLVSLCGFDVRDVGYWDIYDREGLSSVYGWLARIPLHFFQCRFQKTIYLVADKTRDTSELPRLPRVYQPSVEWEYIASTSTMPPSDPTDVPKAVSVAGR